MVVSDTQLHYMGKDMTRGLFDLDAIKYTCSAVGQKTSIKAINKHSGDEYLFDTRTDFWGRSKKQVGGWLATYNLEKDTNLFFDDFTIEDIIVPEPLENVLHSVKLTIDRSIHTSGVKSWDGFMGEGDSFRVELSTLKRYKDGRATEKPYHFESVVDYIKKKYKPEIVTGIETDDKLIMLADKQRDVVLLVNDKDYKGYDVNIFDINKPEEGVINCSGLGKLWLRERVDSKGKTQTDVRGYGRLFKYFQIISQDDVDNYKANCFSDTSWGEKSAYKVLVDCKTDKEAWQVMWDTFKYLYPEPKGVVGWRGVRINIDAMYVFQEMVNMAHLHRWKDDFINVKDVLDKLSISYEC